MQCGHSSDDDDDEKAEGRTTNKILLLPIADWQSTVRNIRVIGWCGGDVGATKKRASRRHGRLKPGLAAMAEALIIFDHP